LTTGFVTIGQSPRDDIIQSMIPGGDPARIIQHGALDNLSHPTIDSLRPTCEEVPFVTRLTDESEVLVSKAALMPFLQSAVTRAMEDGATSTVVLCTGAFPSLHATVPLIFPDRILKANVDTLLPAGKIGIVMPHEDQMELMRDKWETDQRSMVGAVASPYSSGDQLERIASSMRGHVDLIVLDCMGFTGEMKEVVALTVDVPVILANRLVGRIVEEISAATPVTSTGEPS
jgi:protein AroM